jgi:hypothetical protein
VTAPAIGVRPRRRSTGAVKMSLLLAVAALLAAITIGLLVRSNSVPAQAYRPSLFHAPEGGCPAGTISEPLMFRRAGKPVAGCFDPQGDGSIDALYPGESVAVPVPTEPEKPRGPKV